MAEIDGYGDGGLADVGAGVETPAGRADLDVACGSEAVDGSGEAGTDGREDEAAAEVTRSIDVEAPANVVWQLVVDPDRRADWLDDEEAARRVLRLDRVEPGRSLSWTWWDPDDAGDVSRVEISVTELVTGGTRVAVTERPLAPTGRLQARASTAGALWDHRLLGLELLLLTAGASVLVVGV